MPARYPLFVRMMTFWVAHPALSGLRERFIELRGVALRDGGDRGSDAQGGKETENGEFHTLTSRAIVPPAFANDGEH